MATPILHKRSTVTREVEEEECDKVSEKKYKKETNDSVSKSLVMAITWKSNDDVRVTNCDSNLIQLHVSEYGYLCLVPENIALLQKETKEMDADQQRALVFIELIKQEHMAYIISQDSKQSPPSNKHISAVVSHIANDGGLLASVLETLNHHVYRETDDIYLGTQGITALVLFDLDWKYVGHVYVWLGTWIPNDDDDSGTEICLR